MFFLCVYPIQGLPYSIMLWEKFHGNSVALKQAIADGDIIVTTYKGKDMLSYNTVKSGRKKSYLEENKLNSGSHDLGNEEYTAIGDWMKNMSLGLSIEDANQGAEDLVVVTKPKELDWAEVEKVLRSAKGAQEKLIRDGFKFKQRVQACNDVELLKVFKDALDILQKNDRALDHILLWKVGGWGKVFLP